MSHDEATGSIKAFENELEVERQSNPSIRQFTVLDRTRIDLSPSLTILGATLWSHLNEDDLEILEWSVKDFNNIHDFTPKAFTQLHLTDLSWLNGQVVEIRANEPQRTVVIFTHHGPTREGTGDPKWSGGPTESAFATELTKEECWGHPVKVWAFGHTHWSCDFVRDGVRVVSNPRGYLRGYGDARATGWNSEFVLQLE